MSKFRHVKKGVKREHAIISGLLPLLERIVEIKGIKKAIPAKISYSPKRNSAGLVIKFQRSTVSGFKLLAHGKEAIQEIFVVIDGKHIKEKEDIENKLKAELDTINIF